MPRGTQSVPAPQIDPAVLSPEVFDDLMDGLPEEQRMIRTDRIAGQPAATPVPPGMTDIPDNRVMMTNLRYPEELIFLPAVFTDGNTTRAEFVGQQRIQFINGRVLVTEDQADFIKKVSPYVHIEPTEGELLTFPTTGFQTRSGSVLAEYALRYADNQ